MNTLIIYAHPNPTSLNGAMVESIRAGLNENPAVDRIDLIDLYDEGFDSVLRFGENRRRRDMASDPRFAPHRAAVAAADVLVFVYPIWWGRPPAILLGFFDQVFASGFAYRDDGRGPFPERLLAGKQAVCVSTMKGPRAYMKWWLGNVHRILMQRATLGFVGIRVMKFFEFGSMESRGPHQESALETARRWFSRFRTHPKKAAWRLAGSAIQ